MANLEVAADELVRKLKSVDDEVTEARQGLARLKGQVDSLGEALDEQWIEVARAVADLVETAGEEQAALGRETQEAVQAVATLEATGHAAEEAAQADLQASEEGTDSLTQAVEQRQAQMDAMAESGGQALAALEEQAAEVATRLEQVMQQARDFLTGDVVAALETMQTQLADRFEAVRVTLTEQCTATVRNACEEWAERLEEVLSLVEDDGFTTMQVHAQQCEDWAFDEVVPQYEGETELLVGVAGLVGRTLAAFRDEDLPETADLVSGDEGTQGLTQAAAETQSALAAMIDALDGCRQVLSRYSFVDL